MSNTMRWVWGILLILAGIGMGAFWVFSGGIMTIGCITSPPDYAYLILLVGGGASILATLAPAVMLIRKASGFQIAIAAILGLVVACGAYSAYFGALSGSC